jgi:chromosome partitioning protein
VLFVDAEEQATETDVAELGTEQLGASGYTAPLPCPAPAVRTQVLQMRPKYDDIIIDASGLDTAAPYRPHCNYKRL